MPTTYKKQTKRNVTVAKSTCLSWRGFRIFCKSWEPEPNPNPKRPNRDVPADTDALPCESLVFASFDESL